MAEWEQRRQGLPEATRRDLDGLATKYDISDDVIEAFELKHGALTSDKAEKFRHYVTVKAEPRAVPTPAAKRRREVVLTPAPELKRPKASIWSPAAAASPKQGQSQGLVEQPVLNEGLPKAAGAVRRAADGAWLSVENAAAAQRPVAQGPAAVAAALSARVERLEPLLLAAAETGAEKPAHIGVGDASASEVAVVTGRVCCDCDYATDGNFKLNEQSLVLEGSRASSNGLRCELKTAACTEVQVFPGQVIAAVGKTDPKGSVFYAERLLPGAPVPLPRVPRDELVAFKRAEAPSFVVAAGPFTTGSSLSYDVLDSLLEYVEKAKPRAVVLLGPLVDRSNKLIASGVLRKEEEQGEPLSFDQVYSGRVFEKLQQLAATGSQVVLVPSTSEVALPCPALPQPPYAFGGEAWQRLARLPNVKLASNPCTLRVGPLRIAVTSTDPLFPIITDLLQRLPQSKGPADAAAELLLAQRSFFPSHPAPRGHPAGRIAAARMEDVEFGAGLPDLCFLASKLTAMAKCVCGRVFVNPGMAARGESFGSIAAVHVTPPDVGAAESAEVDWGKHVRVDIVKL